ncbi:hypothetical protein [Saccharothrix yanglingensis]|uniref:hypothetical protein n=1 Tax=Saccharothrix yanglingensis TaxID=659496 RepID=UPI0027D27DF6|nr:hypothetical protein [Saccharothrix yanglingensis]
MSRTTYDDTAVSRVESTARATYESAHPGHSWESAPAYQRDHARLIERQRAGVADDE